MLLWNKTKIFGLFFFSKNRGKKELFHLLRFSPNRTIPSFFLCLVNLTAATSGPYAQVTEAFSLCMFLFRTFCQTLPSGPPCSKQQGHWLQARHKIQCL